MNNKFDEQKTYKRLFNKMADYSNCYFPITDFLNDVVHHNEDKDFNKEGAYKDLEKIFDTFMEYRNKVQEYKQLEEQIGCPLKVYVQLKADKKIYVQIEGKIIPMNIQTTHRGVLDLYRVNEVGDFSCHIEKFNNYKKTWWLKADKSE